MQIKDLQKKRMLHSVLLVLLLSAVGMTNAMAQSFTVDDLNYSVNEDETSVTLTGHYYGANATGSLYIPNEVTYDNHTYAVTAIGYRAFYDCRGLTGSLVIPDTVTEIGEEAFSYCWGFTGSLTIGANVSIIGRSAFYRCEGFTGALTMTHPLSSVGSEAFYNCYGLTGSPSIVLTGTIGSQAFYNCSSLAGELTIGEAVTSIGDWAFRSCSSMAAVHFNAINCADMNGGYSNLPFEYWTGVLEIGENVERIPNYMFKYANFTGSLVIPDAVTEIGQEAFYFCNDFTGDLTIGANVSSIGQRAFYRCEGFTGTFTMTHPLSSVGSEAFYNCHGLSGSPSIILTGTIGNQAFYGCSSLTGEITIGEAVTSIGSEAFRGCSSMAAVHFNAVNCANVNSSNYPFYYCTGILEIGPSVERIPSYMFHYANFSGSLVIPNAVTEIGECAFKNCSGFNGSLTIGDGVTTIGNETFSYCRGFTGDLTIGANVSSIGQNAFYRCEGFTGALTMTHPLSSVGSNAFYNCYGLSGSPSIVLTGTIGNQAFYGCSSLAGELTIGEAVTSIGDWAFRSCSSMAAVHFNAVNCGDMGGGYSNLPFEYWTGILEIGPSVERIPNYMFKYASFTSIHSFAEVSPVVGTDAFYGVNKSIPVYVPCGSLEAYQNAAGWSEFTNIQEVCSQQTVTFSAGTNWFSTNVEITLEDLQAALVAAMPGTTNIVIQSKTQSTTYNGTRWRGQLNTLDVAGMYKVTVTEDCDISLTGTPINPAEHPVIIPAGQIVWIGFPSSESMTPADAFAGFAVSGDEVSSKTQSTTYNGTRWRGQLNSLEPGKGYIYKSAATEDRTFVFPTSEK